MNTEKKHHISVMTKECLEKFAGLHIEYFFDGTLGAGGHAQALLENHPEIKKYFGCDRDPEALAIAKNNLAHFRSVEFIKENFINLDEVLETRGIKEVDGFFLT